MAIEKADVVIVGGGASGILLAAKLGQAGKKVVVLEMGPGIGLDDLVSSMIWSRRLKWGGVPVISEGKNPVSHNFQSGWGLGGAAMHQFANWPRLHPDDFRTKTKYDRGLDWYRKQFRSAQPSHRVVGEVCPDYLTSAEAPRRIRSCLGPDVRLMVTLRDPAERAFSAYLHRRKHGLTIFTRHYPQNDLAPQVLGYATPAGTTTSAG